MDRQVEGTLYQLDQLDKSLLQERFYHDDYRPPSDSTKRKWQSVGTDLYLHYDLGEEERIVGSCEYLNRHLGPHTSIRNQLITYWRHPEQDERVYSIPSPIKDMVANETGTLALRDADLLWREFNFPTSLEDLQVLRDKPGVAFQNAKLEDGLSSFYDVPRSELVVLASAIPRMHLFKFFLLYNLPGRPDFRQRYFYSHPQEYVYSDGLCLPPTQILKTPLTPDSRGLYFAEVPEARFLGEGFRAFADRCGEITELVPSEPYPETWSYDRGNLGDILPVKLKGLLDGKVVDSIEVDYLKAEAIARRLEKVRPDSIFMSGSRVACLGVAKYFVERLQTEDYDGLPDITVVHVAATQYSKGFEGKLYETLTVEPYKSESYVG